MYVVRGLKLFCPFFAPFKNMHIYLLADLLFYVNFSVKTTTYYINWFVKARILNHKTFITNAGVLRKMDFPLVVFWFYIEWFLVMAAQLPEVISGNVQATVTTSPCSKLNLNSEGKILYNSKA